SAPFHCSLMTPAGARLARELEAAQIADPKLPVVRNVDGGVTRAAADVRPFLLRQVASPVRWTDCVRRLADEGVTTFGEGGPGRVLPGGGGPGGLGQDAGGRRRRGARRARGGAPVKGPLDGKVAIVTGGS